MQNKELFAEAFSILIFLIPDSISQENSLKQECACAYIFTRVHTRMWTGEWVFWFCICWGFSFFKKKSFVCAAEKGLTYKKWIRKSSKKSLCSVRSSIFMWEHEKFSPRSDCREACLDTVPWMSDGLSKKYNHPGNFVLWRQHGSSTDKRECCCISHTPALDHSDHKSHQDYCYIWQPG